MYAQIREISPICVHKGRCAIALSRHRERLPAVHLRPPDVGCIGPAAGGIGERSRRQWHALSRSHQTALRQNSVKTVNTVFRTTPRLNRGSGDALAACICRMTLQERRQSCGTDETVTHGANVCTRGFRPAGRKAPKRGVRNMAPCVAISSVPHDWRRS